MVSTNAVSTNMPLIGQLRMSMFIFSPSEAAKQQRVQKIVFVTGKMTNVMEYITFFDFAAYTTSS